MAIKHKCTSSGRRELLHISLHYKSEITPTETGLYKTGLCPSNTVTSMFDARDNTEKSNKMPPNSTTECAINDDHCGKEANTDRHNEDVTYHQVNTTRCVEFECHRDKLGCQKNNTECMLKEPQHINSRNKCHDLKKNEKALLQKRNQFEIYQNEKRRSTTSTSTCKLLFLICLLILNSLSRYPGKEGNFHKNFLQVEIKSRKKQIKFRTIVIPASKDEHLKSNKLKRKLFEMLFNLFSGLINFQRVLIVVPLSSLDQFFKCLESGSSLEDSMKFEWARLRSFASFRCPSDVSPVTLSRCGFFYTGTGCEVKCYSCGVRHNQWSSDNVLAVHRRISPNCRHLIGDDQRNVPIGHRNSASSNHQRGTSFISETRQHSGQHCNNRHQFGWLNTRSAAYTGNVLSGANNECQQARLPQMDYINAESNTNESRIRNVSNTEQPTTPSQPFEYGSTNRESRYTNTSSYTTPPQQHSNINSVSNATINKLSPLGVNFDKPRYPQYAVLTVRMSTYNGWPGTQIPRKMAEAGFIYAGYADYARCFFCGGGLRNWEEGDDPWIEHARWFPRCAYVRQNKGDQFVQLVHERLDEMVRSAADKGEAVASRNERSQTQKTPTCQEMTQATTTANNTRSHESNFKSLPCYQSVLELGYASDTIEQIIHQLIENGAKGVTSADILDVIFKMEEEGGSVKEETFVSENTVQRKESYSNEEAASLLEENRRLRKQRLCMICVEKDSCIAFLPCSHLVCCEGCAPAMRKCPKCQQNVQGSLKTWLV